MVLIGKNPPEIIKVRTERETVLVRLPRWFVKEHKLTSRDYLVFRDIGKGVGNLVPWEDHINAVGKIGTRKRRKNSG